MGFREWLRPRLLDSMMRQMNELRPEALAGAEGEVLEIGFGTGLNLEYYPEKVASLTALDRLITEELPATQRRLAEAPFAVERCVQRADAELPFDSGRFDCIVSTWTLCSIPDPGRALSEMRRILRPGGRYLFIEHGLSDAPKTARWQQRLDPLWCRIADGCHMDRPIDRLVEGAGFALERLDRFRHKGPPVLAHMYRGAARPA